MIQYDEPDYLKILDPVVMDNSVESYQYINFVPPSQDNLNMTGNPINIEIQAADKYLHIPKSYLYIEGQLVRGDNNQPYAANTEIALVNNAMMYMFKEISYSIGDKTMEEINNPGQVTTMIGYAIYPDDYNTSGGLMSCWSKDTTLHANSRKYNALPAAAADLLNFIPTESGDYNQGFAARKKLLESSDPRGNFSFVIPFSHMFGFAEYDRMSYNIKHCLSLSRLSDDTLAIHHAANVPNGKIVLRKMVWRVPHIQLEKEARAKHLKYVTEKMTIPIHFSARSSQRTNIPPNVTSYDWSLPAKGGVEKPRWLIIGFQTDKHQSQEQNPAVFDHLNLQRSYITLNSQNYPLTEVLTNFTLNQYSQWCKMLIDFKEDYYGFNSLIGGSQVNQATYRTLFPIFAFDLRKQADEVSSNTINMTVQFYFNAPVPAQTIAYAVIISDRLFKLTSDGKNLSILHW